MYLFCPSIAVDCAVLTIYRRHTPDCQHVGKPRHTARTRNCKCPIWVQGSLGGDYVRESLNLTSWQAASDKVHTWEAAGEVHAEDPRQRIATKDAVAKYLADAQARGLKDASLTKFREVLERRLLEFAEGRGYRTLKQLDVEALREFRATWSYAPITAQKRLEHLRAFFRFCVDSDWLEKNPALAVKSGKVQHVPKVPFSDEEMARILAACRRTPKKSKWGSNMKKRVLAMALLLRYSGLRISDASVLERERLAADRIFIYTQKTGTPVWVPVPQSVSKALAKCPNHNPKFFFWSGVGKRTTAVNVWQETFQKVFARARVPNAHIHRFRHTFAVSLLQKGVSIEIVSVLLAHSSIRVTERHYAPWVKARQEQLEAAVRKAW